LSLVGTAIEVRGLRKSYGDVEAVRGVDLSVDHGEIFALLGPNGAGKTTTVEILEGYRERTAGEATVLDHDPARGERELKERIGIVLQSTGVDPYLTVAETVEMYRGYYPSPRPLDEVIDLVGLEEKRDVRVVKLSGGQQRRLDVAIALAGDPELLFLDEPTTGFDPSARRHAWEIVKNLASLGKTVFLTTHYMDEAQYLAGRVAVISSGEIVAEGPPSSLGGRDTATAVVRFRLSAPDVSLPDAMASGVTREDGGFRYQAADPTRFLHDLTGWALENSVTLEGLDVSRPTLEDVYLKLTADDAERPEPAEVSS
jgi:ABC-2 type transport system ATP-binding protein